MPNIAPQEGLMPNEENDLVNCLIDFAQWLLKRKIVKALPSIYIEDFPFSDGDWVMKFDSKTGGVSFNTFSRNNCSHDYYKSIILHEFFHLAVQKVPNKEDATKIKDDYGDELMKLIDIEADFFTALFYKEKLGYCRLPYKSPHLKV